MTQERDRAVRFEVLGPLVVRTGERALAPAARPHWQAALAIFRRLDAPEAEELQRLLAGA